LDAVAWKVAILAEVGDIPDSDSFEQFVGITNYFPEYVPNYAEAAAILMSRLQVRREDGKKGSQKKIEWGEDDEKLSRI